MRALAPGVCLPLPAYAPQLRNRKAALAENPTFREICKPTADIEFVMRFYPQNRVASFLLLLTNLVAFGQQAISAMRHPSTGNTAMLACWGVTALLTFAGYWGTYWKLTPQGLFVSKLLLIRRLIPYGDIQDISPCPTKGNELSGRMKITVLSGEPVLASPDEYGQFASCLEEHVDTSKVHV
jgi:hypothetical protein